MEVGEGKVLRRDSSVPGHSLRLQSPHSHSQPLVDTSQN